MIRELVLNHGVRRRTRSTGADLLNYLSTKMPPTELKKILPTDLDQAEHESWLMRSYCADWGEDVSDFIADLGEGLGMLDFLSAVFPAQSCDAGGMCD